MNNQTELPQPTDLQPLEYEQRSSASYRNRRIVTVAIVLGALGLSYLAGPWVERMLRWRLPFLIHQHACMSFDLPKGTVAYAEDPTLVQQLTGGQREGPGFTTCVDQAGHLVYYALQPKVMRNFYYPENGLALGEWDSCLLFLHERRAAGGEPRLVCVRMNSFFLLREGHPQLGLGSGGGFPAGAVDWVVVKPGGFFTPPVIAAQDHWEDLMVNSGMAAPLRIEVGQVDPSDESHFTIHFFDAQGEGVIDGRLRGDDTLQLSSGVVGPVGPILH